MEKAENTIIRYCFEPIGYVRRERGQQSLMVNRGKEWIYDFDERLRREKVRVIVKDKYSEALKGIDKYEFLWLIWVAHLSSQPVSMETHLYGDPRQPVLGIFATRSPVRPNNIMLSLVRLHRVSSEGLVVTGTEAFDGSPVLDIKPYSSGLDDPRGVPAGCTK